MAHSRTAAALLSVATAACSSVSITLPPQPSADPPDASQAGGGQAADASVADADADDGHSRLTYTIDFLNAQNAIGASLVEVAVVDLGSMPSDASTPAELCKDAVERRKASLVVPILVATPQTSPCDLRTVESGKEVVGGTLTIKRASVAVLAIGHKSRGQPVLIGCSVVDAAGPTSTATVRLDTLFDRYTAVGAYPGCQSLAARCDGGNAACPPAR